MGNRLRVELLTINVQIDDEADDSIGEYGRLVGFPLHVGARDKKRAKLGV